MSTVKIFCRHQRKFWFEKKVGDFPKWRLVGTANNSSNCTPRIYETNCVCIRNGTWKMSWCKRLQQSSGLAAVLMWGAVRVEQQQQLLLLLLAVTDDILLNPQLYLSKSLRFNESWFKTLLQQEALSLRSATAMVFVWFLIPRQRSWQDLCGIKAATSDRN